MKRVFRTDKRVFERSRATSKIAVELGGAVVPGRDGLPVIKDVAELMGKRFHVIDVEASSLDYEKTVKEYTSLVKK